MDDVDDVDVDGVDVDGVNVDDVDDVDGVDGGGIVLMTIYSLYLVNFFPLQYASHIS